MNAEARVLESLAVVRCHGPDAVDFLQGQLTCDVARLPLGVTQLAACATPQGRVIAILRLVRHGDAIDALLPAELAPALITRLRKFVLRAKVEIERLEGWSVALLTPDRARSPTSTASTHAEPASLAFQHPDGRLVVARPASSIADPTAENRWQAADIAAGLPQILAATTEHFVPQMLNLDLLDAISFTKGCYTGQEIVARTQNLGRIKRRTLRYAIAAAEPPPPLTALHHDGVKVGEVLQSARVEGGCELLAVVALEARDRPLRTATGHTATPLPLPYGV
jgi:folate-binding protein YgfZ